MCTKRKTIHCARRHKQTQQTVPAAQTKPVYVRVAGGIHPAPCGTPKSVSLVVLLCFATGNEFPTDLFSSPGQCPRVGKKVCPLLWLGVWCTRNYASREKKTPAVVLPTLANGNDFPTDLFSSPGQCPRESLFAFVVGCLVQPELCVTQKKNANRSVAHAC